MKAFHACPDFELGSTDLFSPYQTASARPGPPPWIQGKTFAASPVAADASLTCTGGVQLRQPLAALAALTKVCRCCGCDWSSVGSSTVQATWRLRPWSIDSTVKRTSGLPGRPSAMWMSLLGSPCAPESRKV